jgi:hypothetical protein
LACVAKRTHVFADSHPLRSAVDGMLAFGYTECGMTTEADEASERAVTQSRGQDTNAVQAVLFSTLINCRGQTVSRRTLDYAADNIGPGRHPFSFIEGGFQLHAGDFNAVTDTFDLLLERISDPSFRYRESMIAATLLLAGLELHVQHASVDSRWERLAGFWDSMPCGSRGELSTPLSELCAAMTYSACTWKRHYRGNNPLPPALFKGDFDRGFFSAFKNKKQNLEFPLSPTQQKWSVWLGSSEEWPDKHANRFQHLRQAASVHNKIHAMPPEMPTNYFFREKEILTKTAVVPIAMAWDKFCSRDYSEAARDLSSLRPIFRRIGGNVAYRDIFNHALFER